MTCQPRLSCPVRFGGFRRSAIFSGLSEGIATEGLLSKAGRMGEHIVFCGKCGTSLVESTRLAAHDPGLSPVAQGAS